MFLITQPAFYSATWWLVLVISAYCVARYARWWWILIEFLAVAITIYSVDVAWIRHEMSRPGWNGEPDMDIVFAIGLFMRMGFMCAALIPITAFGVWRKRRSNRPTRVVEATAG